MSPRSSVFACTTSPKKTASSFAASAICVSSRTKSRLPSSSALLPSMRQLSLWYPAGSMNVVRIMCWAGLGVLISARPFQRVEPLPVSSGSSGSGVARGH